MMMNIIIVMYTEPKLRWLDTSSEVLQTSYGLTIPYNINYTISVIGSNCVGNSRELTKTLILVSVSLPLKWIVCYGSYYGMSTHAMQ